MAILLSIIISIYSFALGVNAGKATYPANGIDISRWQGEIDFKKVKSDGISFVIMRIGTSYGKDSTFERNYAAASSAGLNIGCYYYTYATDITGAKTDAENVLSWLGGRRLQFPVYYDVEDESQLNKMTYQSRTSMCDTFLSKIKQSGYLPGFYTSEYWYDHYLDGNSLSGKYESWIAMWTSSGKPDRDMSEKGLVWQYSSKGRVNGISGDVDLDICYFNYPGYIEKYGYNGYTSAPKVKKVLDIGEIYSLKDSEAFYTGYSEKNCLIGKVEKGEEICVTDTKSVGGIKWGRTTVKGVHGWVRLGRAEKLKDAGVYLLTEGKCTLDEKSRRLAGLDGSSENLLENVFAHNLFIRIVSDKKDGIEKIGFVYDGYIIDEYMLV